MQAVLNLQNTLMSELHGHVTSIFDDLRTFLEFQCLFVYMKYKWISIKIILCFYNTTSCFDNRWTAAFFQLSAFKPTSISCPARSSIHPPNETFWTRPSLAIKPCSLETRPLLAIIPCSLETRSLRFVIRWEAFSRFFPKHFSVGITVTEPLSDGQSNIVSCRGNAWPLKFGLRWYDKEYRILYCIIKCNW